MRYLNAPLTGKPAARCLALAALLAGVFALAAQGPVDGGDAEAPAARHLAVQVMTADFRRTVRVQGPLLPEERELITSDLDNSTVVKIVPEGTKVSEGDVIAELDGSKIEEDILLAREEIVTAEAELASAQVAFERTSAEIEAELKELESKTAVAQARLDLEEAKPLPTDLAIAQARNDRAVASCGYAEYWLESTKELFEQGTLSWRRVRAAALDHYKATLDRLQAQKVLDDVAKGAKPEDLESAKAALAEARISLQQATESRQGRIDQAESKVKSAQNALDKLHQKLDRLNEDMEKTRISASREGTVVAHGGRMVEPGFPAWRGFALADLADTTSLVLHGQVREADSQLVKVDQRAQVWLLALPGVLLPATVTKVGDALVEDEDNPKVRYLEIEIKLDEPPPDVRLRMTGHAEIEVQSVPRALVIPRACINDGTVTVLGLDGAEKRTVKVAASDETFAVIESGLREGEWVLLHAEE